MRRKWTFRLPPHEQSFVDDVPHDLTPFRSLILRSQAYVGKTGASRRLSQDGTNVEDIIRETT